MEPPPPGGTPKTRSSRQQRSAASLSSASTGQTGSSQQSSQQVSSGENLPPVLASQSTIASDPAIVHTVLRGNLPVPSVRLPPGLNWSDELDTEQTIQVLDEALFASRTVMCSQFPHGAFNLSSHSNPETGSSGLNLPAVPETFKPWG